MGIESRSGGFEGPENPRRSSDRVESVEPRLLVPRPIDSTVIRGKRTRGERRGGMQIEVGLGECLEKESFEREIDRVPDKPLRAIRYDVPWYVNETKVMDEVAKRLRGVTSVEEARQLTRDLAIVIYEFEPSDCFSDTVTVLGCPLKKGEPPEELSLRLDTLASKRDILPPLLDVHGPKADSSSQHAAAAATPTISAVHGEYEDAALQAASAVLARKGTWEAKVLRFVAEGILWFIVPTKPITAAVQLLTDAVRHDEAPQAWRDVAQGQFVGRMCHLDPFPALTLG